MYAQRVIRSLQDNRNSSIVAAVLKNSKANTTWNNKKSSQMRGFFLVALDYLKILYLSRGDIALILP